MTAAADAAARLRDAAEQLIIAEQCIGRHVTDEDAHRELTELGGELRASAVEFALELVRSVAVPPDGGPGVEFVTRLFTVYAAAARSGDAG